MRTDSRAFVATLDQGGPPGPRSATIHLLQGETVVYRQRVDWEVVPPLIASPKVITVTPRKQEYRLLLRSQDRRPFRVRRAECPAAGIRARSEESAAAVQVLVISVEALPTPAGGRTVLTILTDHPDQENVEVPILVLD